MNPAAGVQTAAAAVKTQKERETTGLATQDPRGILHTLVHELRQPLSAIESTAYYLGLVLQKGDLHAREHAARLRGLVEQTNWILSCGLQLAESAPLSLHPVHVNELLTVAVSARMSDAPQAVLDLGRNLPLVRLDPARARALIENLLNLLEMSGEPGQPIRIQTSLACDAAAVILEMGVKAPVAQPPAWLGCGSSLCLDAARRVVEAHGGEFGCTIDPATGISLRMVLR